MNNTIYATFADPSMAKRAAGALFDYGIKPEHLSIVLPEGYVDNDDAIDDDDVDRDRNLNTNLDRDRNLDRNLDLDRDRDRDGDITTSADVEDGAEKGITTTTMGDAASGAAKGAGIGLVAGTVAALAAVLVPGVGIVLGGGALALALGGVAGTTAAGAVAGGVTGYLKDQGVPDEAVENYSRALSSGSALLTVTPVEEEIPESTIVSVLTKYAGNVESYGNRVSTQIR